MLAAFRAGAAEEPPTEWIDPSTGHRVIRLSREPGGSSFYFHQNPFTESGDKMVFTEKRRLFVLNLKTRAVRQLADHPVSHAIVGKKSREVFYLDGDKVCATSLDTDATRIIAKIPSEWAWGAGFTINADETLLAGTYVEGAKRFTDSMPRSRWFTAIQEAGLPALLYSIAIKSGAVKVFHRGNDWFNHIQFSPTDPMLLMYCHEGPWHKVDRIWTIRTDGAGLRKIHARTMDMEIAGHEFWNPDGKIIWYDQQTPKGQEFWLGGTALETGRKLRYRLERDQWSVHFNVSPDGTLFAGDGGGPGMVAKAKDGQWIYLFRLKDGVVQWERLVNLAKHDYRLEPNVIFTPDGKWIVFRSNMHGPSYVYTVEVEKKQPQRSR